jgi:hypothetical protein
VLLLVCGKEQKLLVQLADDGSSRQLSDDVLCLLLLLLLLLLQLLLQQQLPWPFRNLNHVHQQLLPCILFICVKYANT